MNINNLLLHDLLDEIKQNEWKLYTRDYKTRQLASTMLEMAVAQMSKSDSLYFSAENCVTNAQIAMEICRALYVTTGPIKEAELLNFFCAVLFSNVGIVRGILPEDRGNKFLIDHGRSLTIEKGCTDSVLWKHRAERSILYLQHNGFLRDIVDMHSVSSSIRFADFETNAHAEVVPKTDSLVRATQIISFLSGVNYEKKLVQLYYSMEEGGVLAGLGFRNMAEFRQGFSDYFWRNWYADTAQILQLLQETDNGKHIVASLYQHL